MFSFGAKPATPATPASTTTGFQSSFATPAAPAQQNQMSAPASAAAVSSSAHPFQFIQQCYDPSNLNYRFRTYFYNRVEGCVVKYSNPKPASISDRLWSQITNDNPEPEKMIPIIANGFDDLKARAAWQDEQMAAQDAKLKELEGRLAVLLKKTDLETTSQLQQIHRQQLKLVKRVINIMKIFEVAKRAGHRLQPNEEALKAQLQTLSNRLLVQAPLEPNAVRSLQFQIQALQEVDRLDALQPIRHLKFEDPEAMEGIVGLLLEQQKGIRALSETLIKDTKDLEIMHYGFQL